MARGGELTCGVLFFSPLIDTAYQWVMLGDFNMIEHQSDQWGALDSLLAGREKRAWAHLVRRLNLQDHFAPSQGLLRFSWDSLRLNQHDPRNCSQPAGGRILRPLDKIYLAATGNGRELTCSVSILPRFAFSDHAPVWVNLSLSRSLRHSSLFCMNPCHFTHPEYKARISAMWETNLALGLAKGWPPLVTMSKCIRAAGRIDRCWGKRRALEKRQCLEHLQQLLGAAQLCLEADPENAALHMKVFEARELLLVFNATHAKWVDQVIQARWMADGNRGSKLFYKSFKGMATTKVIPALLSPEGTEVKAWDEMVAMAFFSNVLGEGTGGSSLPADDSIFYEVLKAHNEMLTQEEKENLNAPLTLTELGIAVGSMANQICPGPDGIPVEFYKANWQTVGPLVLDCLKTGIDEEQFSAFVTKGAIVLLRKKADQRLLGNKRSITLLNTIYKLGAKAMQGRISPILQRIITPQQSAFLPKRNIHQALLLMGEMLQRAKESGDNYILMQLDVCKAFDRLEWPYLLAVVEKVGMGGLLLRFLKVSFASASSFIMLNGRPTKTFKLTRSVRHGCPISPLAFILAFDTFNHMVNRSKVSRALVEVEFPEVGISTILSLYADDVAVLIKANMLYVLECQRLLNQFGEAYGLRCRWELTKAAFISCGPPPVEFRSPSWVIAANGLILSTLVAPNHPLARGSPVSLSDATAD